MLPFDHYSGSNAPLASCHPALLVFATSRHDLPVQPGYIRGFRDRNPVVPPEVTSLSLHPSLLMRLGRIAELALEPPMRAEGNESRRLLPLVSSQDLLHRRSQVVIA